MIYLRLPARRMPVRRSAVRGARRGRVARQRGRVRFGRAADASRRLTYLSIPSRWPEPRDTDGRPVTHALGAAVVDNPARPQPAGSVCCDPAYAYAFIPVTEDAADVRPLEPTLQASVKAAAREKGLDQTEYVRRALRAFVSTQHQQPEVADRLLVVNERRWD